MALTGVTAIPYGIRDLRLTPYTDPQAATILAAASTSVDLPYVRTLSFSGNEAYDDFRGDDQLVTSHGQGEQVAWSLESGGFPYDAIALINGGTTSTAGTGALLVTTYTKMVTNLRPFFKIEGQAINDNGGDIHCIIWKCKMTGDVAGDFADQAFWASAVSGIGYPSTLAAGPALGSLYNFVNSATVTPIVITP